MPLIGRGVGDAVSKHGIDGYPLRPGAARKARAGAIATGYEGRISLLPMQNDSAVLRSPVRHPGLIRHLGEMGSVDIQSLWIIRLTTFSVAEIRDRVLVNRIAPGAEMGSNPIQGR